MKKFTLTFPLTKMIRPQISTVFPLTHKPAHLELLAGLPLGTIARLRQFETEHQLDHNYSLLLLTDKNLKFMRHFEIYGFGKIHWSELASILQISPSIVDYQLELDAGSTHDSNLMFWLLHHFGKDTRLNQQLCEGLGWC